MSEYSTDELMGEVQSHLDYGQHMIPTPVCSSIIARLRAADKLCAAAKKMGYHGGDFETLTHGFLERPINVKSNDDLRKAIAEYEEEK